MTLYMALNNALSGLRANQTQLSTLSNNIANANTDGYSRQIANQSAVYLANVGAGVKTENVTRNVDQYLLRTIQSQSSVASTSAVTSEYFSRIQQALGQPTSGQSLNAKIDTFFTSFQSLADNPERASVRQSTLAAARDLARNMADTAGVLQDLRFEADQDVYREVQNVNTLLTQLYDTNIALGNAASFNQNQTGLYDQRDNLIKKLSQLLDIRVNYQNDGKVQVSSAGGVSLVDDQRYQLSYSPAQSIDSFVNNSSLGQITATAVNAIGIAIGKPQILVDQSTVGTVNSGMVQGKMYGLLKLRDVTIPEYLSTLDQLAATFRDQVNKIQNQGAGFPPPSTLTGQTLVDPLAFNGWSGQFRMAVLKPDGTALPNQYNTTLPAVERGGMRPLTLSLNFDSGYGQPGIHEQQTIIDEINAYYGAATNKVHINNLNDIRLVSRQSNTPAGVNFAFDLDLENITNNNANVQITNITAIANCVAGAVPAGSVDIGPGDKMRSGAYNFNMTSTGGPMTFTVDVQVTDTVTAVVQTSTLTFNFNPLLTNIKNQRTVASAATGPAVIEIPINNATIATARLVDAEGVAVPAGEPGYLQIVAANGNVIAMDEMTSSDKGRLFGTPPIVGTGFGLSHYFGLNNFFNENRPVPDVITDDRSVMNLNSAYNLSIRSDILTQSNFISTGLIQRSQQSTDPNLSPTYTYELSEGSKVVAQRMADLGFTAVDFAQTGVLPITRQTLSAYGSSFLGASSSGAAAASDIEKQDQELLEGYQNKAIAISGVNLDEEMGNTIIYQNAYAACARVVSVTDKMFTALIEAT